MGSAASTSSLKSPKNTLEGVVACCVGEERAAKNIDGQHHEPEGRACYVVEAHGLPEDHYDIDTNPLGECGFGTVSKATNKTTGSVRAIKTILKNRMKDIDDVYECEREVNIMRIMDHPNIIKLFEVYHDKDNLYLLMELCEGGDLFGQIIQEKFTEGIAASIMQQILRAVKYIHRLNVIHRDVRPENFLCKSNGPMEKANIKLIDFGKACYLRKGHTLKTQVGKPYYIAPEVLKADYNHAADMWSCGVTLYVLLSGSPPFTGKTDKEILSRVSKGCPSFKGSIWKDISLEATQLIKGLLKKNQWKRTTAKVALHDAWIKGHAKRGDLHSSMVSNMHQFQGLNRVVKTALHIVASQAKDDQISALRDAFLSLDEDGDGRLSVEELKSGMHSIGLKADELTALIEQVDADGSGQIEYSEFLASTLDKKVLLQEDTCWAAFRVFDKDGDGQITLEELTKVLESVAGADVCDTDNIQELLKEYDTDGDGQINFQEFMNMLRPAAIEQTEVMLRRNSPKSPGRD